MWQSAPKPRSVFWVVTTHVATSLLWTIALVVLMGCLMRAFWDPAPRTWPDATLAVVLAVFATVAATEHSLHFIRTRSIVQTPQACIVPSIAVFAGLLAGLLFLPILASRSVPDIVSLLVMLGYLIGPVAAFSVLTRYRFRQMSVPHTRGFEVQLARPVEPLPTQTGMAGPTSQDRSKD